MWNILLHLFRIIFYIQQRRFKWNKSNYNSCIWLVEVFAVSNTTSSPPTYSNTITDSVKYVHSSIKYDTLFPFRIVMFCNVARKLLNVKSYTIWNSESLLLLILDAVVGKNFVLEKWISTHTKIILISSFKPQFLCK